ncbi:DUF4129 domain-containing protein [Deinococcus sp. SL84]|uniref:DUF4129 domain-containing protein n=1 Tax=Deinococcus sp. SL84 TaxID=2994663 RepID=UPI002275FA81|nr:DUF4129 domain-containing protein [Deinococcus sp. SL84]MCY1702636.1 DUF4129 domain-containing protein [Deinococcus sp. SL84]
MTESAPAAAGPTRHWRIVAFAALPLVLAGMLPLPALLGLMAVFALTAREELLPLRPQLSLLVLAVNLLVTLWLAVQAGDQRSMVGAFFVGLVQMLAAWLAVQAAERAEDARGRGWLWLLPAFVLAPHPLGLLSLGAAALLRRSADDRALPSRWQSPEDGQGAGYEQRPEHVRARWLWLPVAAVLALLAGLLLPRASLWEQAVAYMSVTEQVTVVDNSARPAAPEAPTSGAPGQAEPPVPPLDSPAPGFNHNLSRAALGYLDLISVGVMLAFILYALTQLRRQLRRPGAPPNWRQVWPLLALLALPLSLLAVILAAQFQALDVTVVDGQHPPALLPPANPLVAAAQRVTQALAGTPLGNPNLYDVLFLLLGSLFLLALLAWVWQLLTARSRPTFAYEDTREAGPAVTSAPVPDLTPLHRVRAAYARTETHLAAAGLHRRASETPAEYLRRAASRWPNLSAPLAALGRAYAPVRYGGGVSDTQADTAEAAAGAIVGHTTP